MKYIENMNTLNMKVCRFSIEHWVTKSIELNTLDIQMINKHNSTLNHKPVIWSKVDGEMRFQCRKWLCTLKHKDEQEQYIGKVHWVKMNNKHKNRPGKRTKHWSMKLLMKPEKAHLLNSIELYQMKQLHYCGKVETLRSKESPSIVWRHVKQWTYFKESITRWRQKN